MKEEKPQKPEIVGTPEENAERLKKLGNDAFAAQLYPKAIQFYSEALGKTLGFNIIFLDFVKNEAILTNRAASYIQIKKYKEALFDCEQALIVNKSFVKAH